MSEERLKAMQDMGQQAVRGFGGFTIQKWALHAGDVVVLRGPGVPFDRVPSTEAALQMIEPMARAHRGEKFYVAVITAVVSEELPPLRVEAVGSEQAADNPDKWKAPMPDAVQSSQYAPGSGSYGLNTQAPKPGFDPHQG